MPWKQSFATARPWTPAEVEILSNSASLIAHVMGENDPSLLALPIEGRRNPGSPIQVLAPLDEKIVLRFGNHVDFVDSAWVASTRTLYLQRELLSRSRLLVACELFESSRRALKTPTVEALKNARSETINPQIEAEMKVFFQAAQQFFEKQDRENARRWKAELKMIQLYFEKNRKLTPSTLTVKD